AALASARAVRSRCHEPQTATTPVAPTAAHRTRWSAVPKNPCATPSRSASTRAYAATSAVVRGRDRNAATSGPNTSRFSRTTGVTASTIASTVSTASATTRRTSAERSVVAGTPRPSPAPGRPLSPASCPAVPTPRSTVAARTWRGGACAERRSGDDHRSIRGAPPTVPRAGADDGGCRLARGMRPAALDALDADGQLVAYRVVQE